MRPISSPRGSGPADHAPAGSFAAAAALAAAALLAATAAAGCASTGAVAAPVDPARVYATRCALCHPAWEAGDYSPEEWPALVRKYAPRAGLTADEREAVSAWLVREAARP